MNEQSRVCREHGISAFAVHDNGLSASQAASADLGFQLGEPAALSALRNRLER